MTSEFIVANFGAIAIDPIITISVIEAGATEVSIFIAKGLCFGAWQWPSSAEASSVTMLHAITKDIVVAFIVFGAMHTLLSVLYAKGGGTAAGWYPG